MALTGSYVDASEAEAYFEDDPRAEDFLDDDNLEWYLKRATLMIDRLSFKGETYYEYVTGTPVGNQQNRQFPRYIDDVTYGWDSSTNLPVVPAEVKNAVFEEALEIYRFLADSDRTERKDMIEGGVKGYSLGGVYSETFGESLQSKTGLLSSEAKKFLSGYIAGAIKVSF